MRTLIIGYGRMGKLVASLCPEYGLEVAGTVDIAEAGAPEQWPAADVAIDFSVADAVSQNVQRLAGGERRNRRCEQSWLTPGSASWQRRTSPSG